MSNRGRPRATNKELELSGSRNVKVDGIESGAMIHPEIPPAFLSFKAQEQWSMLVPPLVEAGTAKEADRTVLALFCDCLARFYDNTAGDDKRPLIDEKERCKILKQIMDIADRFGMNPLSRARSGISKKATGVKQRP